MGRGLGDQQLVVHAFIALDHGEAPERYAALGLIWNRCRELLGVEVPITGLPSTLPTSLPDASGPARTDGVLAALEERDHYRQMVVRLVQQHTINFSMAFTDKKGATARRRIGSASPPGWVEYDRWWSEMAGDVTPAFLGIVRLYLATTALGPAEVAGAVRAAVPDAAHGRFWWERGQTRDQFALWEWSPESDPRAERRVVAVGRSDAVVPSSSWALSEWAWSTGHPALPPLARYFLHAARLRAQVRDWGEDWSTIEALLRQASELVDAVNDDATNEPGDTSTAQPIATQRTALTAAAARVRARRLALDHALAGLATALREPLRSDHTLAERQAGALREAEEELAASLRAVDRVGRPAAPERSAVPAVPSSDINSINAGHRALDKAEHLRPAPQRNAVHPSVVDVAPRSGLEFARPAEPMTTDSPNGHRPGASPVLIRMGFGIDVVGYSQRSHPGMEAVQLRLAALIDAVLADIGVRLADTDHQSQGDSVKVFLPATLEIHKALPELLNCWYDQLDRDNRRHEDRIRIRMSVGVGPIGVAALGFAGGTPVEIARLVDSDLLRQAVVDHPESDLVVLISDELHQWAIVPWRPGAAPTDFERVRVVAKDYDKNAWLWIASPAPATRT